MMSRASASFWVLFTISAFSIVLHTTPALAYDRSVEPSHEQTTTVQTTIHRATRVERSDTLPKGVSVVLDEGQDGIMSTVQSYDSTKNLEGGSVAVPKKTQTMAVPERDKVVLVGTNAKMIAGVDEGVAQKAKQERDEKAAQMQRDLEEQRQKSEEKASRSHDRTSDKTSSQDNEDDESVALQSTIDDESSDVDISSATTPAENYAYADSILSDKDLQCADNIFSRESGWSTTAENSSSGAYGVAQALPPEKMSSAGSDWKTNGKTQIDWAIGYFHDRYGSPCGAWTFWQKHHYY